MCWVVQMGTAKKIRVKCQIYKSGIYLYAIFYMPSTLIAGEPDYIIG